MKMYWGVEVYIHTFLTSEVDWGEWSASRTCCFAPGERATGTLWLGGWVCPRDGLIVVVRRKKS